MPQPTKKCPECGLEKPTSGPDCGFHKRAKSVDGLQIRCKPCQIARVARNKKLAREQAPAEVLVPRAPHRRWAISTRKAHRKNGFDVQMTVEELEALAEAGTHCSICGRELIWDDVGGREAFRPTMDRIHNERVIRADNVWMTCRGCNTVKGHLPMLNFVRFCEMVAERFGEWRKQAESGRAQESE